MIPIGDAISLVVTSPIFTVLLSPFLLGEKINCKIVMFCLLGFSGALLIAKPSFLKNFLGVVDDEDS